MTNVYEKVNALRKAFHSQERKKTGYNGHSKFQFFELQDFIADVMKLCDEHKVCIYISEITSSSAVIKAVDIENDESEITVKIVSAMAQIPKATDIQNVGGTITYMRRYAWTTFLEIVENDVVDVQEQQKPVENELTTEQMQAVENFAEECHAMVGLDGATGFDIEAMRETVASTKDTPLFPLFQKTFLQATKKHGWVYDKTAEGSWRKETKTKVLINTSENPWNETPFFKP